MKSKGHIWVLAAAALLGPMASQSAAQNALGWGREFTLSSTTFVNNTTVPISTIDNIVPPGTTLNGCSIDGSAGGDQSPELTWKNAPWDTRSFVVVLYDVTAAFTHWGMYNIPVSVHALPQNAGASGSPFGTQIVNDFGNSQYNGPCPPSGLAPYVHHYVFTVYALNVELSLPGSANFPANSETLYQALITAGREHHILASASLTGLYSTTK